MDEKLLLTCENAAFADEIINKLKENGIASRLYKGNRDKVVGAYSSVKKIAIYVFAKDYKKALDFIKPIAKVKNLVHRHQFGTALTLVSLVVVSLMVIYICMPGFFGLRSVAGDIITLLAVIAGFVFVVADSRNDEDYNCKDCGNKRHQA